MQTGAGFQEKEWGVCLSDKVWTSAENWPGWAKPHQRDKWRKKGLIVWDRATQMVA